MKDKVFSTQVVLKSLRTGESQIEFYTRLRKSLYAYLMRTFPRANENGKTFAEEVPEEEFLSKDVGISAEAPQGAWHVRETVLNEQRVFLLTICEPRSSMAVEGASDHALCTETIIRMFEAGTLVAVGAQVSVRVWVEYQPFAGFFKTRKLPRRTPAVLDCLANLEDVFPLFAPRLLSRREEERLDPQRSGTPQFYPVRRDFMVVSDEKTLMQFQGHLVDYRRPIPLVVFFGDRARNRREAAVIAEACWAKCRVWILREGVPGLARLLETAIPGIDVARNFSKGWCRVFFPAGRYRQDDMAQPCYHVPWFNRPHFRKRVKIGLMRFFEFSNAGWIDSEHELRTVSRELFMQEVLDETGAKEKEQGDRIRALLGERDEARAKNFELKDKLDNAQEAIVEFNRNSADLLNESAEATAERDRLLIENAMLKAQIARLRGGASELSGGAEGGCRLVLTRDDAPKDFATLQWAAERVFPHLAIVPGAWKWMDRKSGQVRFVTEMWSMLWSLEHVLFPMLMDKTVGHPAQKFLENTGYQYSPKDSSDLPAKFDKLRDVVYDNRHWRIEHHIKNGSRDATLLRVYFDVDSEGEGRLIVGVIGEHLPTVGTARVS